tara:strand:- start:68 stop:340 length:273 start_codon:yes stop_codon:yes gene_type:complete
MSRKQELLDTVATAINLAKGISKQTIEVRSALVQLTRSFSSVSQISEDAEAVVEIAEEVALNTTPETETETETEPVEINAVLPEQEGATT